MKITEYSKMTMFYYMKKYSYEKEHSIQYWREKIKELNEWDIREIYWKYLDGWWFNFRDENFKGLNNWFKTPSFEEFNNDKYLLIKVYLLHYYTFSWNNKNKI